MLKKLNPYRLEFIKNGFIKYDGYYYSGFVLFTVFVSIALSIPLIGSKAYFALIIPLICCIIMLTNNYYTIIDFKNRKFKEAYKFLGKEYGEWKTFPNMKYISLVSINKKLRYQGTRNSDDLLAGSKYNQNHFEVRIFVAFNNRYTLFEFNKYDKALLYAKIIAKGLNEKLLDATQTPPVFIKNLD